MLRFAIPALLLFGALATDAAEPAPLSGWRDIVAETPFSDSIGAYDNLLTIRRWVLTNSGYCEQPGRHILFDARLQFLGYLTDPGERAANQDRINDERRRLAAAGRVAGWVAGAEGRNGYPFVLSCDQPDAYLPELVDRYLGKDPSARLWGTWDGLRVGSEQAPVSLQEAMREVYVQRQAAHRFELPETLLSTLAGKVIIESGGVRGAASAAGAVGIMQLSPAGLADCRLKEPFVLHRLAQIDCALYLLDQNHRNLAPVFDRRFAHLPARKASDLYRMLLVQSYHTGIGRVISLLDDPGMNEPARYFAEHEERFKAGDIALGMVFHNLGREDLGFAALYYVADVAIATEAVCARVTDLPGCERDNPPSESEVPP